MSNQDIIDNLIDKFGHPGAVLFRGRELIAVNEYMRKHQLELSAKVLDLGCGEGYIGDILFNKIDVGLDVLESELNRARRLKTYKKLVIGDARRLSFRNQTFDLVFSNSVIEHIYGIDDVLSEVSRVLKKDGLFVFTSPSVYFAKYLYGRNILEKIHLKGLGKIYSSARNKQLSHFNQFNLSGWKSNLTKSGLKIKYYQYYLSKVEIAKWDQICLVLKISQPIPFLHNQLNKVFSRQVDSMLLNESKLLRGGSILVVAVKS